jgi:hypothetical protein
MGVTIGVGKININSAEDGVGSGLSLTNAAPLKGNIPSIFAQMGGNGGVLWRQFAQALMRDGSIKNLAEGVEASNAVHMNEAATAIAPSNVPYLGTGEGPAIG